MKRFPFKTLFFCIFLPPICYILTIQGLEGYLKSREFSHLNSIIIQNQEALFEGRYSVREEVNRNISDYFRHDLKYTLGIRVQILVKTRDDRVLYPTQYKDSLGGIEKEDEFSTVPRESLNYTEVAAENFRILNEGLLLSVDVRIKHNGWLSNAILIAYVFAALWVFRWLIRKGLKESEKQEKEQKALIEDLSGKLRDTEAKIEDVEKKESNYQGRISALKKDKKDLSKDVDGLLEELEQLEAGLEDQIQQRENMAMEVLELRGQLDHLKYKNEKPKHKKKNKLVIHKRFKVLYKNLDFTDRAIEGFFILTDEFQLKAEETIHKLNEDVSQIPVKRKVFGKGGKMNILEGVFAYSGRIYFQKDSGSKIKIVAIGTKNTQEKDITYLEGIS